MTNYSYNLGDLKLNGRPKSFRLSCFKALKKKKINVSKKPTATNVFISDLISTTFYEWFVVLVAPYVQDTYVSVTVLNKYWMKAEFNSKSHLECLTHSDCLYYLCIIYLPAALFILPVCLTDWLSLQFFLFNPVPQLERFPCRWMTVVIKLPNCFWSSARAVSPSKSLEISSLLMTPTLPLRTPAQRCAAQHRRKPHRGV